MRGSLPWVNEQSYLKTLVSCNERLVRRKLSGLAVVGRAPNLLPLSPPLRVLLSSSEPQCCPSCKFTQEHKESYFPLPLPPPDRCVQGGVSANTATVADGDDASELITATSRSQRRTGGDATTLSPNVLAAHNRSASVSVPRSIDRTSERRCSPMRARSRSRSYSRTPSPSSRRDGGEGGLEEKKGGERGRPGGGGRYRRLERNTIVNVSPVRSGDGSTSSQTRGFRRLTRRLSFHQRQAQANIQVCW